MLGEDPLPHVPPAAGKDRTDTPPSVDTTLASRVEGVAQADRHHLQALLSSNFTRGAANDGDGASAAPGLRPGAAPPPRAALEDPETGSLAGTMGPMPNPSPAPDSRARIITAADLSRPMTLETEAAAATAKGLPVRRIYEWRPLPLLCKRFNVPDPYRNKPPPAQVRAHDIEYCIAVGSWPVGNSRL